MKIALEFDDFSPKNSNFGLLEELKEHYPGFKVTMFTTPWEIRWGDMTPITNPEYAPWVNAVKKCEDWLEIAVHGLTHAPMEFSELSYDEAKKRIMVAEKMFINRGIKYAKIFKAPFWALSAQGEKAIKDLGFTVVKDGYYNWNLADEMPKLKVILGHGHVQNEMGNGLEEVFQKLMKLPTDTEFVFLSEYLKKYGKPEPTKPEHAEES